MNKTLFYRVAVSFFISSLFFTCIVSLADAQSKPRNIADTLPAIQNLGEVVVIASRVSEKLLAAPVSISKLTNTLISQTTSPSFFDAIGNMKGVHMIVPSLGFKIINTRGFSNTTNVRFVQMVDNVDNQSPHIGAPVANSLCPGDLDIENVEIIQGVASTMYGMNATNGLANFKTKDPFTSPGFSIQQQVGVNHVSDPNQVSPKIYNETSIRWAKIINPHWAFKINAGFTKGYDWVADNNDDLNATANQSVNLLEADNPGNDPVNGYGNESSNRKTLSLALGAGAKKNYVVARTGYAEKEVTDYYLQNGKGDVAVFYKPSANADFSYTYRRAFLNNVYQRSNRFRLENYLLQQNIVQFKNSWLQLRAYINSENTGDSYNLRSMAENMDRAFKTDTKWYSDYASAYNNAATSDIAAAHHIARAAADNGRLQPGTDAFNEKLNQLKEINNWDIGAALHVKANLVHAEGTIDLGKLLHTKFNLQTGGDFREYIIIPDGNYFINPTDTVGNLNYKSQGVFVHVSKNLFHAKLKVSATLRAVSNEYFNLKWNPRLTAVYAVAKTHFVRFSFQNGFRFPSIFEGFSNINSGGVKRVGGLKVMSNGIFENSWLKSSIDAFKAAVNKDVNTQGLTQAAAIVRNSGLLKKNDYSYLKPEQMHSYEIGYRAILLNNRLSVDVDAYFNSYSNFIAQIEATVPNTAIAANIPDSLFKTTQGRYRLWTNSKTVVHNYGTEMDLKYILNKRYSVAGNLSYQTLKKTSRQDGLEDGYNTPQWITNASFNGENMYKKLSFTVTLKYQSAYYYQSFLINGDVPAIFNADAQLSYAFTKPSLNIKIGATNISNHYYYSILGGPQVGGMYYTTLTYTLPSRR